MVVVVVVVVGRGVSRRKRWKGRKGEGEKRGWEKDWGGGRKEEKERGWGKVGSQTLLDIVTCMIRSLR